MNSQSLDNSPGSNKHVWTSDEDALLVECLVELRIEGKFLANNGFKSGYLEKLESMMHKKSPSCTLKAIPNIQSRIKTLKSLWQVVYDMVNGTNTSGFGWDPIKKHVTADKDVWDKYVKMHKRAAIFRNKRFPHYDQLTIAFRKDHATGRDAQSGPKILKEIDRGNERLEHIEEDDEQSDFDPEFVQFMDSQSLDNCPGSNKHVWTSDEDALLVECLVELRIEGKFLANNGFKPGYLGKLESMMHKKSPGCTLKAIPNIQSRIKTLKSLWQVVYDMVNGINTSGFGWDPIKKHVTADKDVWDKYVKTHKRAAIFRYKSFPHYDQLTIAFRKDYATGSDAQSDPKVLAEVDRGNERLEDIEENDEQSDIDPEFVQVMDSQSFDNSRSSNKHVWTPDEDALLVECLVELRIEGKFLANDGFKPGHLRELESMMHKKSPGCKLKAIPNIQSRIKTLKSLWQVVYDMVYGTNTSGFGWDPVSKHVTADKDVWDKYVKMHRRAAIFRYKSFPHYDQLTIAFGKDHATGRDARSGPNIFEEIDRENEGMENIEENDEQSYFDPEVQPLEQPQTEDPAASATSNKRKRNNVGPDEALVDALKDAWSPMGEKFDNAISDLAKTINQLAHKSDTKEKARNLWGEMRKIDGLTRKEIYVGYFKILRDEMLLAGFQGIPAEDKADWIRFLLA